MLIKCFLFIFVNFILIKPTISFNPQFMLKCLKDNLELHDICAIEGSATTEDEETLLQVTNNYLYIKKNCSPNERCKQMGNSHLYQCFPKITKLKIGDKCIVNEECYTGLCSMDICQGIDYEGDCSDYPNACKPGLTCTYSYLLDTKICTEYSYLHEKCGEGEWGYYKQCFPGLGCQLRDNGSGVRVCKKWGTALLNSEVEDERLCESGIAMEDTEIDNKLKCISVEEDGECDDETHKCSPLIAGIGENPDITEEFTMECISGATNTYTCPLGVGKIRLYEKYINKYNELYDIEKLKKSQHFTEGYFNEKDLTELYIKYKNYEYLKAYELIDFEGNANGIYSCEYDFIWTFIDSEYIKINFINMLLILFILI